MPVRPLLILLLLFAGSANAFDYQLEDLDGKLHRASEHKGKFLVINFWATWCEPCIYEMPELEKFHRENRDRAAVWGVTFESTEKQKIIEFVDRLGVTFPILGHGQDPKTGYATVTVLPTTLIVDREGLFLHKFEGPITAVDIEQILNQH